MNWKALPRINWLTGNTSPSIEEVCEDVRSTLSDQGGSYCGRRNVVILGCIQKVVDEIDVFHYDFGLISKLKGPSCWFNH